MTKKALSNCVWKRIAWSERGICEAQEICAEVKSDLVKVIEAPRHTWHM